ncbi:MAG: hypothetical protein K6F71_11095 [Ruminococcus sp.]|uniref:hypothetical protein n=1 Tax=Ruminococcus sp. TaxID=41978 RepID=UPI0025FF145D|nr:hypothetical protein [Ruminococcus sp.]MCR5541342.1 hypothetical protein [Ruminococcus sp.]
MVCVNNTRALKSDCDSESDFSTRRDDNVYRSSSDENTFIMQFVGQRFMLYTDVLRACRPSAATASAASSGRVIGFASLSDDGAGGLCAQ